MKITDLFPSLSSVNQSHQKTTVWFGRVVTPLTKSLVATAIFVLVVIYLARRFFSNSGDQGKKPGPDSINLSQSTLIPQNPEFSKYDVKAESSQAIQSMLVHIKDNQHPAVKFLEELDKQDPQLLDQSKFDHKGRDYELFSEYKLEKDRYTNILQLKSTMVDVKIKDEKVDFNGAKFVNPVNGQVFVLMQGPKDTTVDVTREMMLQNGVKQIVCLTKKIEQGTLKCEPYWKEWNTSLVDGFSLRTPTKLENWPALEMFHYEAWPDHGTPSTVEEFIKFIKLQRSKYTDGAVVVHCSAGIGRSGVFMVATLMMDLVEKGATTLNPLDIIQYLRKTRPGMVQTSEQLQFCFKIALHLLNEKKN